MAEPRANAAPSTRVPPCDNEQEPPTPDAIFGRYHAYVARVASGLLGPGPDVDDVVQEVFAVVMERHRSLDAPEKLHRWLATVTVNRARNVLRWRRVRRVLGGEPEVDLASIADTGASPELRAFAARLYRALDATSPNERIAWTLRHVEGHALEEVATLCGVSLATAKRRIAAAQATVRRLLGDE